jgi:hypothetical protein
MGKIETAQANSQSRQSPESAGKGAPMVRSIDRRQEVVEPDGIIHTLKPSFTEDAKPPRPRPKC